MLRRQARRTESELVRSRFDPVRSAIAVSIAIGRDLLRAVVLLPAAPTMSLEDHADLLGPELFRAIERKGYEDLTAVQRAVLDPALAGRDLRITSQTGSGKTLAIGLTLRALAGEEAPSDHGVA